MPDINPLIVQGEHGIITEYESLPFRHVRHLGMGMSALVEMVEERRSGQVFAHKRFRHCRDSGRAEFESAFQNELKIMKRLRLHPHVIKIFWSYSCGGDYGMLLEPVASDGDLRTYLDSIQRTGQPPTTEQSSVLGRAFGCLANGLAFIHGYTIRHKDIKPHNILVHKGQMIFTDFGIARDANGDNTTTTGPPVAFTKRYCAPEVAAYESRNRKSDIFSLGCVFLEMIALLAPGANEVASDPRPYWQRVTEVQSCLTQLETSAFGGFQLFRVCNSMLEYSDAHRIRAEAVLQEIRSIQEHQTQLPFEIICRDCNDLASCRLKEDLDHDGTVQSSGRFEPSDLAEGVVQNAADTDDDESEDGYSYESEDDYSDPEAGFYENWGDSDRSEEERSQEHHEFSLMSSTFDPLERERALRAAASRPLTDEEKTVGYMYIFCDPNTSYIKIGRTTTNVLKRLEDLQRHCKRNLVEFDQKIRGERELIQNVPRVEKLVFIDLMEDQLKQDCNRCEMAHFEWFRTTPQHAAEVIKKYSITMTAGYRSREEVAGDRLRQRLVQG